MVSYMMSRKINLFLFIFASISIITLYSARSILPYNLDNIYVKQILYYFIAFSLFFSLKSNKLFFKYVTFLYAISCFMLISLLLFTVPINNARCWFVVPFIGTIQPSEFVKIILLIITSMILTSKTKLKFVKAFLIFLVPTILTYLEPDTGLVIIYAVGFFSMIFSYFNFSTNFIPA